MAVDHFYQSQNTFSVWQDKFNSLLAEGLIDGKKVILIKPQTFMNDSGAAVIDAVRFWKIDLANILIVYDDLAFDVGTIKIKESGSSGGHNGMDSIITHLNSSNISRLRIGINNENLKQFILHDAVLNKFSSDELKILDDVFKKTSSGINTWLVEGIIAAMNECNT